MHNEEVANVENEGMPCVEHSMFHNTTKVKLSELTENHDNGIKQTLKIMLPGESPIVELDSIHETGIFVTVNRKTMADKSEKELKQAYGYVSIVKHNIHEGDSLYCVKDLNNNWFPIMYKVPDGIWNPITYRK